MSKAYILAEIASSHYGNYDVLLDLIYMAAESQADGVKFQVWRDSEIKQHKRYENLKKFSFSQLEWIEAAKIAKGLHLDVWCEVYGHLSLKLAIKCGYDYLKSDRKHMVTNSVFASLLTNEESQDSTRDITWWRFDKSMTYLPLNMAIGKQSYPASPKQGWNEVDICAQLANESFNVLYACHQNPVKDEAFTVPLAAYHAGASVIEKHICMNRKELQKHSRDYLSSLEPQEFKNFVDFMKNQNKVSVLL